MKILKITAAVLLIIGGINWGLVGAFNFDLVAWLFGDMTPLSRIIYGLVGLAAICKAICCCRSSCCSQQCEKTGE